MKRLLIYFILLLCCMNVVKAIPIEREGLLFQSKILKRNVAYSIILPDDYNYTKKKYPVLYMLHGIGGDYSTWIEYGNTARVMENMAQKGEIHQFIIVIPDGYSSYYSDRYDGTFSYESFFIKEFVPYIDRFYRIMEGARFHSILGFSMGGFGAMTLALRHRDLFNSFVALSPSIRTESQYKNEIPQKEWDNQWGQIFGGAEQVGPLRLTDYYKARSPYHIIAKLTRKDLKGFGIMLDIGDKENTLCESNEELHRLLLQKGIEHEWTVRSGGHDFFCWNAALPKAFSFINKFFCITKGRKNICKKEVTRYKMTIYRLNDYDIYLPLQAKESDRKYPIIYIQGTDSIEKLLLVNEYQNLVNKCITWPTVLCFIHEGINLSKAVTDIEYHNKAIRASQRMRGLICFGSSIKQAIEAERSTNLFTGIVCVNAVAEEGAANDFERIMSNYNRYPRCWIEVFSRLPSYGFSSKLHILLRKEDKEHEFRALTNFGHMKFSREWILFLNNRIHI